jgi:hypothetical protein
MGKLLQISLHQTPKPKVLGNVVGQAEVSQAPSSTLPRKKKLLLTPRDLKQRSPEILNRPSRLADGVGGKPGLLWIAFFGLLQFSPIKSWSTNLGIKYS